MAASSFAEFITSRRRELELTLGDVADRVGVSTITVSNWSSGGTKPKPENLVALANLLEVPANDLAAMAGVSIKSAPEKAVNLMPAMEVDPVPEAADEELDEDLTDSTGPVAALRGPEEEPTVAEEEPAEVEPPEVDPPAVVAESEQESDEAEAAEAASETESDEPESDEQEPAVAVVPIPVPEAEVPDADPSTDDIDSELAELMEEAAAPEAEEPELVTAAVAAEPAQAEPTKRRPVMRRPTRAKPAERPITALPLTYVEDPKQLTRYRIRWALTIIVLAIMFFVLLWASRELLSALSEVKQAVTPGGIGTS
ncbi:MAG: helix-turn-helix domain-containing protein [Acidimicrobiia bacterium]